MCGGGDGGGVEHDGIYPIYYLIYLITKRKTHPGVAFGLGDDYLIARVRTLCFKSLFIA